MLGLIDKLLSLVDGRKLPCEVGYQQGADGLLETVRKYAGQIKEIYFSLPGDPTYYGAWGLGDESKWQENLERLFADLDEYRKMGLVGNLCMDASCFGANFASVGLLKHALEVIAKVREHIPLKCVTAESFPLAEGLHQQDPNLKIRASEGFHLEGLRQFETLVPYFDGFYIGGECTRDVDMVTRIRKWCDDNGKTLHFVPNNACLYKCPYFLYHENLQSHAQDVAFLPPEAKLIECSQAPCEALLSKPEERVRILQGVWIRPEDIRQIAYYFDSMRLATRTVPHPEKVVQAYCEGHWDGDLCEILEAMHEHRAVFPKIMNGRFPKDWFKRTSKCHHGCESCDYCKKVLEKVAD